MNALLPHLKVLASRHRHDAARLTKSDPQGSKDRIRTAKALWYRVWLIEGK